MATLYGAGLSPFVRKVRVVLAEKKIAYDHDPVVPFNVSAEYKAISPLGKIPAYRDEHGALADSSVICAYLERRHPTPALYPTDPYQYGRALWFEEYADSAVVGVAGAKIFFPRVVGPRFFNQPADETVINKAITEDLPPLFDYLESQITGDWLAGSQFSIADVAIGTQFVNMRLAGVSVDTARWPKLARYVARVHERPSFQALIDEDRAALAWGPEHRTSIGGDRGRVPVAAHLLGRAADALALPAVALQREGQMGTLDGKGVPHRRRAVLPGPHVPVIWWQTGQKLVPVLRLEGETVSDSTRIIAALEARYPTPPLYPADPTERARALALEDFFDEELGPHIRRALFFHLLDEPAAAVATLTVDESEWTRRLYRAAFPLVRMVMRHDLGIDAERSAQSRAAVMAALDRLEAELQPSGYLVGSTFSVADLTAAAMFAPLLRADEFPYRLPPLLPPVAAWRASTADRPGFRWALEIYRRHRGTSAEVVA